MEEIWKKSEFGCGNYEFSNLGRVRNIRLNKIIKGVSNSRGYLRICNTRTKTRVFIHKEVARLFLGERLKEYIINHKDGDILNNKANNLEYITQSDNIRHSIIECNKTIAVKHEDANNICSDYLKGMKIYELAIKYNRHRDTIDRILKKYNVKINNPNSRDNQQPNHKYNYIYEGFNDQ